ncbi:YisL family protein [Exiguobacterium aurantiacum]|uniref:YisL family protein n=1 Tax=Exiguobacterium aurantiacum TaxID=33987 RepID=A0ABY5FLH1_9BACL|nr:YisL family protein [Exiguobacterium aurantiacum]UTT42209.1 YisL family protein [Exiguobacterium aurantiacum]
MPLIAFLHTHVTSWVLLLVLFAVAYIGYKNGNKSGKIAHMAFRLMLLVAFGTGLYLYLQLNGGGMFYHVKITVGLLALIFGEMTLIRVKKHKPAGTMFGGFAILALVTIFIGYALPYGQSFFSNFI